MMAGPDSIEAEVAEKIADCLEADATFQSADWCDLGEVTVWWRGKCFRMTVRDITDRDDVS